MNSLYGTVLDDCIWEVLYIPGFLNLWFINSVQLHLVTSRILFFIKFVAIVRRELLRWNTHHTVLFYTFVFSNHLLKTYSGQYILFSFSVRLNLALLAIQARWPRG